MTFFIVLALLQGMSKAFAGASGLDLSKILCDIFTYTVTLVWYYLNSVLFLTVIATTISGPVPGSLPGALSYRRTSNEIPKNTSTQLTRKRRCLGTIISLLWPQVVGPVDEGIIAERGFDEIPKTLLEYHLDKIRKKAREEEMNRLAVREYMQKRLEKMNQIDFPNFHGNRLSFIDLFHRIRYFMGVLPENHFFIYK